MGARAKKTECALGIGLVRSGADDLPIFDVIRPDSTKLCSWDCYKDSYPYGVIIKASEFALAKGLAVNAKAPTIITGETGTGKEVFAKLLHQLRCELEGRIPFVAVNCATISGDLCESLLFGHRRGAFTGADASTSGYIGEANGGILFLDEIQNLHLNVQQKLLRVLNDGSYNRLGETTEFRSHFQLVTASTKDLDDEVDAGRFLLDLRSRLTGVDVNLKPLRERREDMAALVACRLTYNDVSIGNRLFKNLVDHLSEFYWQGNIRQLFKAIDTWVLMSKVREQPLSIDAFPEFKGMHAKHGIKGNPLTDPVSRHFDDIFNAIIECRDLVGTVETVESLMITEAIKRHKTIGDAAKSLGVPRSTIDGKRKKYRLYDSSMELSVP